MNNTISKAFAILICLCATQTAQAQYKKNISDFYDYFNASTRAKHAGKLDSAIYYARMAIKSDPDNNKPDQYLANLLLKKENYQEGIALLQKNILSGDIPQDKYEYIFDNYDSIKTQPEIIQFEKKIPALIKQYYATSYNHAFASMIQKMLGQDQALRGIVDRLYGNDTVKANEAYRVQAYLDTAVNLTQLLTYLKENGFPAYREMDNDIEGAFLVIIHHIIAGYDGPKFDELQKMIEAAIYEGKYSPYAYMLALDWRSINRTGKQVYGTYIGAGSDGVVTFDPPIANVAAVDMRRAKWKQGPLKEVPLSDWRNPKLPSDYRP